MQAVIVFCLLVASSQAFLFGPGGLFAPPAPACDPCAAARAAPYYPPAQPAYQPPPPAYQPPPPAYQPQPAYQPAYNTAPIRPTYHQTASYDAGAASGGYVQPPPPPPPSSYATGPVARFHH